MKIGITQIILGKTSLEDTLNLCGEAGYEAVELVFGEDKDLNVHMNRDELLDVRRRCAAAGRYRWSKGLKAAFGGAKSQLTQYYYVVILANLK